MDATPLPTEFGFKAAPNWIVIHFDNPFCQGVFFLQPQIVDQFIEQLQAKKAMALELAEGTLEVPSQVILGPNGQPMAQIPPSPEVAEHIAGLHLVDGGGAVGDQPTPEAEAGGDDDGS